MVNSLLYFRAFSVYYALLYSNLTRMDSDSELDALESMLLGEGETKNPVVVSVPTSLKPFDFMTVDSNVPGPSEAPVINESNRSLAKDLGLEDSSDDDEAVDNYLNRKFNEYGQDVHLNLKKLDKEKKNVFVEAEVRNSLRRGSVVPTNKTVSVAEQVNTPSSLANQQHVTVFTDPIFGIKIIRPLISSVLLKEKMSDKKPVATNQLRDYTENINKEIDWVIAGAIITKSPVKTSQNGHQFSIWQISDLRGAEVKTASVFLFKNAHRDLWKTAQGMVVAILNPGVLDKRQNSRDEATLSVDNPQKVMILGQSKDLGTCKSKKKNGDVCGAIVNLGTCEYCIYHVKQEFKNISKRAELQSSTAGRGLNELRNKVLGKNEVFYGGQSFSAVVAKKNPKLVKKDSDRMLKLSEYYGTTSSPSVVSVKPKRRAAEMVQASPVQRAKDMERLRLLKGENERFSINENQKNLLNSPEKSFKFSSSLMASVPRLSTDDFTFDIGNNFSKSKSPTMNKMRALELVKKKPIQKSNPNLIKYRGTENGKKRYIDDLDDSQPGPESDTKRRKVEVTEEKRKEEMRKSRIQRIMDASSSHANLVELKENEAQESYFNNLEKKEAMEEKMISTYKMACKAVACKQCNYLAFKAADICKQEKHPLKLMEAEKRFFKCQDCGNRTVTLQRLPKFSCKNCKSSKWVKTGMMREKTVTLNTEKLSIRGDEEQYIGGAISSNMNLNLNVAAE